MAFTDKPVVSKLMDTTGLNDLLASSGQPAASPIGGVASSVPKSPAPIREYQAARPPVNPRFAGPMQGIGGAPQPYLQEPGVMSAATLQSPNVHDLLSYYGVSAPQNIDDHLFIHDPQAFAKHPLIAGAIENGLGGLANFHVGRDTAETLSNIAGSVIGNQAMHQQAYNARAMAPIAQAQQIGALMENKQRMELQQAQAAYEQAHQKWYEGQFDNQQQVTQARADLLNSQQKLNEARANAINSNPNQQLLTNYHSRLKALGNGDESAVDPEQAWKLYTDMQGEQASAAAQGKVDVQTTKNKGTVAAATIKANAPSRSSSRGGNPSDRPGYYDDKAYVSAQKGIDQLTKTLQDWDNGRGLPKDEYGLPLSPREMAAKRQQAQGQIATYRQQQEQIKGKYHGGKAAAPAPAPAPSNAAVTHTYIPGRGIVPVGQ